MTIERREKLTVNLTPSVIIKIEAERQRIVEQTGLSTSFSRTVEALITRALAASAQQ